jgi:hypothetical protein
MMTGAALYTLLAADAGLVALVVDRIYPIKAPQNPVAPFVVWQRISAQPFSTHSEATGNQYDLVRVSIYADTYEGADAVADACYDALDNIPLSTGDSPTFKTRADIGFDDAVELHRIDLDFLI